MNFVTTAARSASTSFSVGRVGCRLVGPSVSAAEVDVGEVDVPEGRTDCSLLVFRSLV